MKSTNGSLNRFTGGFVIENIADHKPSSLHFHIVYLENPNIFSILFHARSDIFSGLFPSKSFNTSPVTHIANSQNIILPSFFQPVMTSFGFFVLLPSDIFFNPS